MQISMIQWLNLTMKHMSQCAGRFQALTAFIYFLNLLSGFEGKLKSIIKNQGIIIFLLRVPLLLSILLLLPAELISDPTVQGPSH